MRALALALSLAFLPLTACSTTLPTALPPPNVVASRTVLDEQAVLAVELAYKAARLGIETGVDAGLIRGAKAARFAEYDLLAYTAVTGARRAYEAGNATTYMAAVASAREAITTLMSLGAK